MEANGVEMSQSPYYKKRNRENLKKFCKLIGLSKEECKKISKGYLQLSRDLNSFTSEYTDEEIKQELSKGLFSRFIKDAPLIIVGCAHKDRIAGRWSVISTTIALQNMVIAAWALGVGSCWIGAFGEDKVRKLLNIPDRYHVVAVIPFGYPAKIPGPKRKKSIDKITSFNKFSK